LALRELGHDNITFVLFKFTPQQPSTETMQAGVELPTIPEAVQTSIPQAVQTSISQYTEAPEPSVASRLLVGSLAGVVVITSVAGFFILSQPQEATSIQPSVPSVTTGGTSLPPLPSTPNTASLGKPTTPTIINKSTP
jgi:hypothetical protein